MQQINGMIMGGMDFRCVVWLFFFFFFQAEDGIRDGRVTGVQTCALPISGMTIEDIDLVEINEAFAVQVIASARELGIDQDKLNVNGGAIAVGHPFGMTGARITSTLLNSLQFHDKTFGLETMCVGGGQGMAMVFERLS